MLWNCLGKTISDVCFHIDIVSSLPINHKIGLEAFNSFPALARYGACFVSLTHWGRATHICVSKLTIIGSDNGLSPGRCQAIIRTNAEILLIRPIGTNFSEILIELLLFSFKKKYLKVSSAKRWPQCVKVRSKLPMCYNILYNSTSSNIHMIDKKRAFTLLASLISNFKLDLSNLAQSKSPLESKAALHEFHLLYQNFHFWWYSLYFHDLVGKNDG